MSAIAQIARQGRRSGNSDAITFRCAVEPAGEGTSRISQGVSMHGPLGPLFSALMGERLAEAFVPILRGLATAAEKARV